MEGDSHDLTFVSKNLALRVKLNVIVHLMMESISTIREKKMVVFIVNIVREFSVGIRRKIMQNRNKYNKHKS